MVIKQHGLEGFLETWRICLQLVMPSVVYRVYRVEKVVVLVDVVIYVVVVVISIASVASVMASVVNNVMMVVMMVHIPMKDRLSTRIMLHMCQMSGNVIRMC